MVRCSCGGTVSIWVGDQALPEYQVEKTTEGNIETYTCCELTRIDRLDSPFRPDLSTADIEATEGSEYQVKIDDFLAVRQGKFEVQLTIDGIYADCASDFVLLDSNRNGKG
jgi:hypothetical protein